MISSLWIYVTENCNLQCKYCFNPDNILEEPKTFKIEIFKKILEKIKFIKESLNNNSQFGIYFFGGEPTLFPELLKEMCTLAYKTFNGNVRFILLTNGLLVKKIQKNILELYNKYNFRIQISVDSNPEIESDRILKLGQKTYAKKMNQAFDFLIYNSIQFNIRATLTPKYIHDYFNNFIYFLKLFEKNDKLRINFVFYPEFIYNKWKFNDFLLLKIQIKRIILFIKDYYLKNRILLNEGFLRKALKNLYYKNVRNEKSIPSTFCGFAKTLLAVSPEGELYSCHRVYKEKEMEIGNLLKDNFDISKMEFITSVFNSRQLLNPHPKIGINNCEECEISWACQTICPALNYKFSKNDKGEIKIYCNYILYQFYRIYNYYAEKYLWDYYNEENFQNQVKRLIGIDINETASFHRK